MLTNGSLSNLVSKGLDLARYVIALCKRYALLAHQYLTRKGSLYSQSTYDCWFCWILPQTLRMGLWKDRKMKQEHVLQSQSMFVKVNYLFWVISTGIQKVTGAIISLFHFCTIWLPLKIMGNNVHKFWLSHHNENSKHKEVYSKHFNFKIIWISTKYS